MSKLIKPARRWKSLDEIDDYRVYEIVKGKEKRIGGVVLRNRIPINVGDRIELKGPRVTSTYRIVSFTSPGPVWRGSINVSRIR